MTTVLRDKTGRYHFIGIGGSGMCGIAEILVRQGFTVSGSDLSLSEATRHLEALGVKVFQGHDAANVDGAAAAIYSSAVGEENPERAHAVELGIPVVRRAEMLAELMQMKTGIAIAGTHGKTTTTSLVGSVLSRAGLDPTVIVGGRVRDMDTNARLGTSDWMVVEADEYDRSFLKLTPSLVLMTMLESEHMDTYGTMANLRDAFAQFANSVPDMGRVLLCHDDPELRDLRRRIDRPVRSYGFSEGADVRGISPELTATSRCRVLANGHPLGIIEVPLPGRHNLLNALGAVTVGLELEIPFSRIREALAAFRGVRRRFDLRGEEAGIAVIDDYAHHPTEVKVTLKAARDAYPGRRIVALLQPHLYTRTQQFHQEFAEALSLADIAVVTDVYPAREEPIEGVTGELVVNDLKELDHEAVHYAPRFQDIVPTTRDLLSEGDVVITLGAGTIYHASTDLLERLRDSGGTTG